MCHCRKHVSSKDEPDGASSKQQRPKKVPPPRPAPPTVSLVPSASREPLLPLSPTEGGTGVDDGEGTVYMYSTAAKTYPVDVHMYKHVVIVVDYMYMYIVTHIGKQNSRVIHNEECFCDWLLLRIYTQCHVYTRIYKVHAHNNYICTCTCTCIHIT